ncbi:MAG: helix-turn-helix domain-containing protein [Micrococcales bacterium]|nr:helix-turn-helix domain-containing protein [Micrococcales bacterium]
MRTEAPALVPIFRSALQARLLLHVLTATKPVTAADLARLLDTPEPTVSREVRRLLDAGFLAGERVGRAVVLSPATDNPATAPLRQLLVVTYGPARLLEQALIGLDGIDTGYVHGSWAARYHGEPGPPPGDIDLLLVGHPSRRAVDDALAGIETRLSREVNVTYVTPERWRGAADPFVTQVRSRPLVELDLVEEPTP